MASGTDSFASGCASYAAGNYSTAAGLWSRTNAANSFAVGAFNVGGGDPVNWVLTDPLFEVGNGTCTNGVIHSDALVIYKNGNATFQGSVSVAPGGDIPMFTGQ